MIHSKRWGISLWCVGAFQRNAYALSPSWFREV